MSSTILFPIGKSSTGSFFNHPIFNKDIFYEVCLILLWVLYKISYRQTNVILIQISYPFRRNNQTNRKINNNITKQDLTRTIIKYYVVQSPPSVSPAPTANPLSLYLPHPHGAPQSYIDGLGWKQSCTLARSQVHSLHGNDLYFFLICPCMFKTHVNLHPTNPTNTIVTAKKYIQL